MKRENYARLSPVTYLVCVVWEVDFVEYLSCLVLDSLHLHLVRRVFPLAVSEGLLQSLGRVQSYGMSPGPQELVQILHQVLTAGEETRGQPHQLPAPLLRQSVAVVSQLLHHLAVNLVPEYFLKMRFIVPAGPD